MVAVDVNTGKIAWRTTMGVTDDFPEGMKNTGRPGLGGAITTASGLTFVGATDDARFRAFETKTGKQVWETKLPASGYATPVTYEVKGRQYVAIMGHRRQPDRRAAAQRHADGLRPAEIGGAWEFDRPSRREPYRSGGRGTQMDIAPNQRLTRRSLGGLLALLAFPLAGRAACPPVKVLFVCQAGTVNSPIAREQLKRGAKARGIPLSVQFARVKPEDHLTPVLVAQLSVDGIDPTAEPVRALRPRDITSADIVVAFNEAAQAPGLGQRPAHGSSRPGGTTPRPRLK